MKDFIRNVILGHHLSMAVDLTPWSWQVKPYFYFRGNREKRWVEAQVHWLFLRVDLMGE